MQVFHKTRETPASLFDRLNELVTRDLDVGDVEVVLGEFGTGEDEPQVSVSRDRRVFGSLREETDGSVFTRSTYIVSEAFSE